MLTKKGVVAIVYDIKSGQPFFLILHRSFIWAGWEFPKGPVPPGMTNEQAVFHEMHDSTGLTKITIEKQLKNLREFVKNGVHYIYFVYIIRADINNKVDISAEITEHDDYLWASYEETMQKLYWDNEKREVEKFVKELKSKNAIS